MTTKSPSPAARSTVSSRPERSRSRSTSASTASSEAPGSRLPTSRPLYSPSVAVGRTPISIENVSGWPCGGQLAEVELRLADRDDRGGVDRGRVPGADRVAHRLVEHGLAADALDDDRRRRLAGAEAGHAHVAAERARGLRDALLDLLGGHLGLDAHARLGQLGDGCGDGGAAMGGATRYRRARAHAGSPPGSSPDRSATSWAGVADWAELLARWLWSRVRALGGR